MAEGQSNLRGNPCRPSLRLTKPTYVLIASIGRALPTRGLNRGPRARPARVPGDRVSVFGERRQVARFESHLLVLYSARMRGEVRFR